MPCGQHSFVFRLPPPPCRSQLTACSLLPFPYRLTKQDEVAGRPLSDFIDLYRRDKRSVDEVHAELLAKVRS